MDRIALLALALAKKAGGGGGAVDSVNGQTGTVVLDADDVGALPVAPQYEDADCMTAFILAMQNKANKLGLDMTVNGVAGFNDTQTDNQLADARAMAKMYAIASGYDELCKIWNTSADKYICSKGNITTRHLLHSSVYGYNDGSHYANSLTDYYDMLGGKTGTWSPFRLLGAIIQGPDDTLLCGFVRYSGNESASSNRFTNMKTLVDIAYSLLANPSVDVSTLETTLVADHCDAAEIIKLPMGNMLLYEKVSLTDESVSAKRDTFIYGYNNTDKDKIASCTKVLTAMTALDYADDLNEIVTLTASDVANQTGGTDASPILTEGEKFTIRELLYAMMMPSSNRAAQAVARHIGNKLIAQKYGGVLPHASSITAVYTQSGTVYENSSLNILKPDLVVTAYYADGTSATVSGSNYVLSGSLVEGTSTITATYDGKTASFNVVVSESPYAPVITGYTSVGNPNIDGYYRLTGTASNFIKTPFEFDSDGKSWELRGKINVTTTNQPAGGGRYYDIVTMVDSSNNLTRGMLVELNMSAGYEYLFNLFASDTASSWNIVSPDKESFKITDLYNADMYFKCGWTGDTYYIAASADGITWSDTYRHEWTNKTTSIMTGNAIAFGTRRGSNYPFGYCIYVDSLELDIDGTPYWRAV